MKKIITIIVLLSSVCLFSQVNYRDYDDTHSTTYSFVFGKEGMGFNFSYQYAYKDNFGFRADLGYMNNKKNTYTVKYNGEDKKGNYSDYFIGAAPFYSLKSIIPDPFDINIFLGLGYRYEEIVFKNFDKKKIIDLLPEDKRRIDLLSKDNNHYCEVYGGAEIECCIFEDFYIVVNYKKFHKLNKDKGSYSLGGGIKMNF